MDLNQLYFDHQLLLIRAKGAASCVVRHEHEAGASRIARRIGRMQRRLGAAAASKWEELAAVEACSLAPPFRHQQGHAW